MVDQSAREELDKLHERITRLRERVANLEAQQPHINAALIRIEGDIKELTGKIGKAMWVVLTPIIALLIGVAFKFLISGQLSNL